MAFDLLRIEAIALLICGLYNLAFAGFHASFWTLFQWPGRLRPSGSINVAITQTLNIVLTYCFLVYGGTLMWAASGSMQPHPSVMISGAGFWLLRAVLQPALFSAHDRRSVGITIIFLVGFAVHAAGAVLLLG